MVRRVRKTVLPLKDGQEIDLSVAFREMKPVFDVRYDPEGIGFKGRGMHIIINRVSYCVFRTGSVTIMGKKPVQEEEDTLNLLWQRHLKHCVH